MSEIRVQKLSGGERRVETGVVQFGDDWPGVFIRGDNAAHFALALGGLQLDLAGLEWWEESVIEELRMLLASCDVRAIRQSLSPESKDEPILTVGPNLKETEK